VAGTQGKLEPVDICIVGAGAGGGVLARELAARKRSVTVLEVGSRPSRAGIATYRPDWELRGGEFLPGDRARDRITLGPDSEPFHLVRFKGVGGSTMHYEGQCNRMHPRDLRRLSEYGIGADWPLAYEDLLPHYDRVEAMLGVSGALDDRFAPPRAPYPNPPIGFSCAVKRVAAACERLGLHPSHAPLAILSRPQSGRGACNFCGSCVFGCLHAAISNMSETYIPAAERDGARVLDGCMATRVRLKADGRHVDGVELLDADGTLRFQPARAVAIAGNAVETARLLLMSRTADHPDGLANGSGLVGRNFMVHTHVRVGGLLEERVEAYRGPNINGVVKDFYESDERRGYVGGFLVALRNAQLGPVSFFHEWLSTARPFGAEFHARMENGFGHSVDIDAYGESFPDASNRVELDPETKDTFGLPVPRITVRHSENSRTMADHMKRTVTDILAAAGARETRILRDARLLGTHLMGTCRMGNDPKTSVCNPFGRTHDIENLFIADGSLFPTSTPANPTLTIQALSTRLALHLDTLFSRRDL
jgi:choline dehydrogenase-like flavoprotein